MKNINILFMPILVCTLLTAGCASQTGGTVLGGVAGAGLGAAVTGGSAVGTGIGAVGGAVVGSSMSGPYR